MSFWGFSVLQRHGVLLLGGDFFYGVFPFADWMQRWPKFIAAARGKSSQKHHFLSVAEVTLGIFGVQVWGFSVLQRHERKKEPNSSFSMGFRSYVRHFRGAILGLLRPSLPWCFPIRGPAAAAAKASAAAGGKGSQNS